MATEDTSSLTKDIADLKEAAALILEREEERRRRARQRAKRRRHESRESVRRMHRSVETIKWCCVGICSVWVVSFVISIVVLVKVHSRVTEIGTEVENVKLAIDRQVQSIRDVIEHPFANAGARLGGSVDDKLKEFLGVPDSENGAADE